MADRHDDRIVILGAGQAGARVAETLRGEGHHGPITLVGAEADLPYERPQLSKDMLLEPDRAPVSIRTADEWSAAGIRLLTGTVALSVDATARLARLDNGQVLTWDRLVLATGTAVRRLPALEAGPVPVRYLRTIADAVALRRDLRPGCRLLILGGGVIGLEVAAAAVGEGCVVDLVEAAPRLLSRAVPQIVADRLADRHRQAGIRLHCGRTVTAAAEGGVILDDGHRLPVDLILIGIGVEPAVGPALALGIADTDGIRVDAQGRTTMADVFAVGDVACQWSVWHDRWLRVETWANAQNQAIATARGMAGTGGPYQDAPWFWSDQFDLNLQVCGDATRGDMVVRGDPGGSFTTIHLVDGRVNGAVTVNAPGDMAALRRLVTARALIDGAALADPGFNLRRAVSALTPARPAAL